MRLIPLTHPSFADVCEDSAQNPSPGMSVRVFLFERTHRERNELWYIMYIIPETDCKVNINL